MTPSRILLVQTSFLGDTILSTPVIAAIKSRYPKAELWMMTTPLSAELVIRDPLIKGVIAYDKRGDDSGLAGLLKMGRRLKSMHFDMAYSLHRSYRTALLLWLARIPTRIGCSDSKLRFLYHVVRPRNFQDHDVLRNLSILSGEMDLESAPNEMRLFAPPSHEIGPAVRQCLPKSFPYAVLVPASAWKTKMWHWQGFQKVAEFLLTQGVKVVLVGSKSDEPVCTKVSKGLDVVNLAGRTTISEAMFVIKHAGLVVCNDSMSLHMASAMKIPTVAIFCATSPEFGYGPWKNRAIIIERKNLACKPCRPHGSPECPNGTETCIKDLSADEVIKATKELLAIL